MSEEVYETSELSFSSFKGCPNKCVDGFYINPYTHKRLVCQYCMDKRKEMVRTNAKDANTEQTVKEALNLPEYYLGYSFDIESVFPKYVLAGLTSESVKDVKNELSSLMQEISLGDVPKTSVLFNLGAKSNEDNFIFPFLVRAYMSGLKVSPLITSHDLICMRNAERNGTGYDRISCSYTSLLDSDVCVVVLDAGAVHGDVLAVKGLMQLRAKNLRPTIIFTNVWNSSVHDLHDNDSGSYNIAKLCSVEYIKKLNTNIKSEMGITSLFADRNNL